nr:hypothetical protein [Sinorhizobium meliloti]
MIELLNACFGGAATTMIYDRRDGRPADVAHERSLEDAPGSSSERSCYPIAVGMAFIGAALASLLALEQPMATGLIALAYLGPRGSEVLFMRWFAAKLDRQG